MNRYPLFLLALVLMCTSCIKDELPNTECDITSAWVEGDEYAENFYEPSQMRLENISRMSWCSPCAR